MMKTLLTIAAILISAISYGQGIWTKSTANVKQNRLMADSVLIVPRDTGATNNALYQGNPQGDSGRIAWMHGRLWIHDGDEWDTLAAGADLSAYMKYSDSAAMLLPYLRKADTTGFFIRNQSAVAQSPGDFRIIGAGRAGAYRSLQNSGVSSFQFASTGDNMRWGMGFSGSGMDFRLWSYENNGNLSDSIMGFNRSTSAGFVRGRLSVGTTIDDGANTLQLNGNMALTTPPTYSAGGLQMVGRNTTSGRVELGTLSNFGINLQSTTSSNNSTSNMIRLTGTSSTPSSGAGLELAGSGTTGYISAYNRTGSAPLSLKISHTGGDTHINESGGSVGIGNTSPGAKLDITGASSSTGNALRVRNSTPSTVFQVANNGDITLFNSVMLLTGSGTPEGVKTAPVGSMYLRTDGGAATTFYIKESGSGNTGWVGK